MCVCVCACVHVRARVRVCVCVHVLVCTRKLAQVILALQVPLQVVVLARSW